MEFESSEIKPINFKDLRVGDLILVDGYDDNDPIRKKIFKKEIANVIDSQNVEDKIEFLLAFKDWHDGHDGNVEHYESGLCPRENCWWFYGQKNINFYKNNLEVVDIFSSLNESEDEWYMDIVSDFEKMKDLPLVRVIDPGYYYPTYLKAMYELGVTGLDDKKYKEIELKKDNIDYKFFEDLLHKELPFLGIPQEDDVCYFFGNKDTINSSGEIIHKLKRVSDGKEFIMSIHGYEFIEKNKINESTDDEYSWIDSLMSQEENFLFKPNSLFLIEHGENLILIKTIDTEKTTPNENFNYEGIRDDGWRIIYRAFNFIPQTWESNETIEKNWAKHLVKTNHWKPISQEKADAIFSEMDGYYDF